MITSKDIEKAWTRLDRHDRVRIALYILGKDRDEARAMCGDDAPSLTSINIALSSGDRQPTLELLEAKVKEALSHVG